MINQPPTGQGQNIHAPSPRPFFTLPPPHTLVYPGAHNVLRPQAPPSTPQVPRAAPPPLERSSVQPLTAYGRLDAAGLPHPSSTSSARLRRRFAREISPPPSPHFRVESRRQVARPQLTNHRRRPSARRPQSARPRRLVSRLAFVTGVPVTELELETARTEAIETTRNMLGELAIRNPSHERNEQMWAQLQFGLVRLETGLDPGFSDDVLQWIDEVVLCWMVRQSWAL